MEQPHLVQVGGGGTEGTLPNGSNVVISASSFVLDASESTAAGTLSISGGAANSTYTFVFANSVVSPSSIKSQSASTTTDSNGISVTTTPSPCTLGTSGTGLPTSCTFNVSASSSTPAGKYTIALTAQGSDGSTTSLTPITIIVSGSSLPDAKAITEFSIESVNATITGQDIALTLPYGTDVTALKATYVTTGSSVTVNGVTQDDGITPNDFTNPVEYVVHAADGTTLTYTVTVTVAPAPRIAITTPGFTAGSSIIQGSAFTVVATLTGSNVPAQTISVTNSATLTNAGISVTSDPSPCTLSTPSNLVCTFTVLASWNLATAGNYTLQLSNSGSITMDQTSIAFSVYSPAVYLPQTGASATYGWPSLKYQVVQMVILL